MTNFWDDAHRVVSDVRRCATVVCMIITTPGGWKTKARAVLHTWARRCHIPVFFYSRDAAPTGHAIINASHTVPLDVAEGRSHLTAKTMAALRYSLTTYGHVADWFLKCDDDTWASIKSNSSDFVTYSVKFLNESALASAEFYAVMQSAKLKFLCSCISDVSAKFLTNIFLDNIFSYFDSLPVCNSQADGHFADERYCIGLYAASGGDVLWWSSIKL